MRILVNKIIKNIAKLSNNNKIHDIYHKRNVYLYKYYHNKINININLNNNNHKINTLYNKIIYYLHRQLNHIHNL